MGLSKPKMTTSATLGLGKNCPHSKRITKLVVLFNHWFMPYKVAKGRLSFQCGTLQAKNDYKCNTWSRQKLSPQLRTINPWVSIKFILREYFISHDKRDYRFNLENRCSIIITCTISQRTEILIVKIDLTLDTSKKTIFNV